jgi:hypothetical protein
VFRCPRAPFSISLSHYFSFTSKRSLVAARNTIEKLNFRISRRECLLSHAHHEHQNLLRLRLAENFNKNAPKNAARTYKIHRSNALCCKAPLYSPSSRWRLFHLHSNCVTSAPSRGGRFCVSSLAASPRLPRRLLRLKSHGVARSGLLDHLNGDRFDCRSNRLFPRGFLHWRAFGLGLGNRSLRRFRSLGCLTRLTALS